MPEKRINKIITELPFERKLLGAGALLLAISVFLPWYQDLDSFKTGDVFLGLTGPTYFAGMTILALAIADMALLFIEATGKIIPLPSIKPSTFYLASGLIVFYLLLLVNSVFFHNKFGVNITSKDSQFGMFMAFIAASLITIGGYLATREKSSLLKEFQEKAQESLIKIPDPNESRKPRDITRAAPAQQPNKLRPTQTSLAENSQQHKQQASKVQNDQLFAGSKFKPAQFYRPSAISAQPAASKPQSAPIPSAATREEQKSFQPFRTDL